MVEVFSFEVQLTTIALTHSASEIQGRRSADIVTQQLHILLLKLLRLDDGQVFFLQLTYGGVENLWDVCPTKLTVKSFVIY
jgi:hypothetical protein